MMLKFYWIKKKKEKWKLSKFVSDADFDFATEQIKFCLLH